MAAMASWDDDLVSTLRRYDSGAAGGMATTGHLPGAGGRYWVRNSDLFGVNEARYHCANRPLLRPPMLAHQPRSSSIVASRSRQASCTALVTGPGTGSSTSSHALTGCTSLVVEARNTSLASRTTSIGSSTSVAPYHSST